MNTNTFAPRRTQSDHKKFIEYWHSLVKRTRRVTPILGKADFGRLKQVLAIKNSAGNPFLKLEDLEAMALYFLASYRFKGFAPTLTTFLSSGVLTGLMNQMKNGEGFWKELNGFGIGYLNHHIQVNPLGIEQLKAMKAAVVAQTDWKKDQKYGKKY